MNRETYPSDLTDAQWKELAPLLPLAKPGGRPPTVYLRQVIKGICRCCLAVALAHGAPRPASLEYSVGILSPVEERRQLGTDP